MNCTQVLLKFHENYVSLFELSLSTTNRCTQTQLITKILVLKLGSSTSVVIVIREGPEWVLWDVVPRVDS